MIWAYIIWIACLSFAAPSSVANLQERNIKSEVSNELHFVVNNDFLLSEEDPLSFSFDAVEPKTNAPQKTAITIRFYPAKLCVKHTETLNPLNLDLPPPFRSHFI